jgi:DNA primase
MSKRKNFYLTEPKLRELLDRLGVDVIADTSTDLIAFCPFHNNRGTPAFNISKNRSHLWKCHNGRCAKHGNILTLLTAKGYSRAEAEKLLVHGGVDISEVEKLVMQLLEEVEEHANPWDGIDSKTFVEADERSGFVGRDYFESRGIGREAYEHFGLGYSSAKGMVIIPIHNESSVFSGVIGRTINTKRYEYSEGLARRELIFGLHLAKQYDSIILTEGSLDSIYIWQAGYPNVGAILGSAISPQQYKLIKKYFSEVICFFDNDDAGNSIRDSLMETLKDVDVSFVTYPDRIITQDDGTQRTPKDPGELTNGEIKEMIEHRSSRIEWLLENSKP